MGLAAICHNVNNTVLFWSRTYLGFQSATEGILVLAGNHCGFICLFVSLICMGIPPPPYLIIETHMKTVSGQKP